MCGISGLLFYQARDLQERVLCMASTLRHRGPNALHAWVDEHDRIALAHNRLSILDLSQAADQPMLSHNGRYVMIFNGEIYNYPQIKKELQQSNVSCVTTSDTEVLLEAFALWGVEKTLQKCHGMFAIALWDKQEKQLMLARDRFGEKPLYVGWIDGALVFASELKAFHALPSWNKAIDDAAVSDYFSYGYVPTPRSIYKNIQKLTPGTYLTITHYQHMSEQIYWSAKKTAEYGLQHRFTGSQEDARIQLDAMFSEVVSRQRMADVPVGVFLSGGIDSSLIAALMQKNSPQKIKSFTIGFDEAGFNEAFAAKKIAGAIGSDHHELYVTPQMVSDVLPTVGTVYDEPFADSSQLPTYFVSKLAASQVTVALSGDGGDELFGGYNRYLFTQRLWRLKRWLPYPLRVGLARFISSTPFSAMVNTLSPLLPSSLRYADLSHKLEKVGPLFSQKGGVKALYQSLVSSRMSPHDIFNAAVTFPATILSKELLTGANTIEWMMFMDSVSYLRDDILTKVDRAAMANSLETRAPFLDHAIYAFAWSLPLSYKIHAGVTKTILRKTLHHHVPSSLFSGPKRGFAIPLKEWLNTSLKAWRHDMLSPHRLAASGYLNVKAIGKLNAKSALNNDEASFLWSVLMFQSWYETYHNNTPAGMFDGSIHRVVMS